jgi:poly(hydroxyalkanoate) depolymerase family esterase
MRKLGPLTASLASYRRRFEDLLRQAETAGNARPEPGRLEEVQGFGSNPGNLAMYRYVPERLSTRPGLVVVLHGCTQTATGYDRGAGWSTLAEAYGFAVLAPEQRRTNNPKACFNWFEPKHTARGAGEALSIRQMIEHMAAEHGIDRSRIFVTGLSAGGAMTSVMLATYPELFAAGAVIAGLPYGTAGSVAEAFESMFQTRPRPARAWGDLVRAASSHRGPWPRVAVWQGSADQTVVPGNAEEILKQWTDLHGLDLGSAQRDTVEGFPRRRWLGRDGRVLVEEVSVTGARPRHAAWGRPRGGLARRGGAVPAGGRDRLEPPHRRVLRPDRRRPRPPAGAGAGAGPA